MTSFSPAPVSKLSIVTNDRWLNEDNRLLLPARQALIGNIRIYSTYFLICVCSSVGPPPPVRPFVCLSAHLACHRSS